MRFAWFIVRIVVGTVRFFGAIAAFIFGLTYDKPAPYYRDFLTMIFGESTGNSDVAPFVAWSLVGVIPLAIILSILTRYIRAVFHLKHPPEYSLLSVVPPIFFPSVMDLSFLEQILWAVPIHCAVRAECI
jgi:hypothetical protein